MSDLTEMQNDSRAEATEMNSTHLSVQNWGCIDYDQSLSRQMEVVEAFLSQRCGEQIIICSHPPIVTLGRGTQAGDVFGWQGEVMNVQRGGRATYHGPSQVVVYPILDLSKNRAGFKSKDLHGYMRCLEESVVSTLESFGVEGSGRNKDLGASLPDAEVIGEATGVWIGSKKIASVGIAVKRWISYHGISVNIDHDPKAFQGLNPCGFKSSTMVSLEEILDQKVDRQKFADLLVKNLKRKLQEIS